MTLFANTLGNAVIGGTAGGGFAANFVGALGPYTASENGTITEVCLWTTDIADITLGVYNSSAGVPTTLVADSAGGLSALTGWTCQPVSGSLVSGSTYWVGFNTDTDGQVYKYDVGSKALKYKSSAYVSGTLPGTFGTEDGQATSRDYSAYITYTATGGTTPKTLTLLGVGGGQ